MGFADLIPLVKVLVILGYVGIIWFLYWDSRV
jgi:hypothetical protein